MGPSLIAALDVGTTTVRCFLIGNDGTIKHSASSQHPLLFQPTHHGDILKPGLATETDKHVGFRIGVNNSLSNLIHGHRSPVMLPSISERDIINRLTLAEVSDYHICYVRDVYRDLVKGRPHYHQKIELLYPKPGFVEIEPDSLWNTVVNVVRYTVESSCYQFTDIKCLGISCQRCSFIMWNKRMNHYYHRFVTWKDIRANSLVDEMNNSISIKALRFGAKCLFGLTRNKRFLAGSVLKFMNAQVIVRLLWVLKNIPGVIQDAVKGEVAFGTIDTWLLYKLSDKKLHITDVSCASATGIFDPFTMAWAEWAIKLFNIPRSILPDVVDSAGEHFGEVSTDIFGYAIPIKCSIADQSASLFGACCFNAGDLKITLGTGTFLNVNTGHIPSASLAGLYPVVGWRFNDELVYVLEGSSNDTGSLINWAISIGLMDNPTESAKLVTSVSSNDGVYFVPAFSGLQTPVNDAKAGSGFIGVKPTTKKEHLLRSILESIVFRVVQLYEVYINESTNSAVSIRVDGGVANNDYIMQLLADLTGLPIERPQSTEMSALGAAYLAGLSSGVWSSKEDILTLRKINNTFFPNAENATQYMQIYLSWGEAVKRFCGWYHNETFS